MPTRSQYDLFVGSTYFQNANYIRLIAPLLMPFLVSQLQYYATMKQVLHL